MWGVKSKKEEAKIIATIPASDVTWKKESILIWVPGAKGKLKIAYGTSSEERVKSFLLLNNIPLVKWHDNENNCPTCEQFLSAGYGIDKVDMSIIELIKTCANKQEIVAQRDIDAIKYLLELLEEGIYLISFIPHYPTDGEGNIFWNMSNDMKVYKGLSDSWYSNSVPAFLLPTQPTNKYDESRIVYYREQIRKGVQLGGVAYYFGGYLSALLDGHHRAMASLAEGETLTCLTICKVDSLYYDGGRFNGNVKGFLMGGQIIEASMIPSNIVKIIDKRFHDRINNRLNILETDKFTNMLAKGWDSNINNIEFIEKAKEFPTYKGIESIEKAGDLSDERIERLLKEASQVEEEDLSDIFQALIALNDSRVIRVAKAIATSERWVSLWPDVYNFLSRIKTQEVEDFFMEYLINDDGERPYITKIVDLYFRE